VTETSAGLDARLRAELGMPFLPTMVVEIECLRYALELAAHSAGTASGVRAP
jgi:hypothetical protein